MVSYPEVIHLDAVIHSSVAVAVIVAAVIIIVFNAGDESFGMNHDIAAFGRRQKPLQRGDAGIALNAINRGAAEAARMPRITMTTTSSIRVKPA